MTNPNRLWSEVWPVPSDYDAHVRAGVQIGDEHYYHLEFWTPEEKCIGVPTDYDVPEGSVFIGIHEHHRNPAGEWCGGYIHFSNVPEAALADAKYGTRSNHALVAESPLHIAPSLQCRSCPKHGFIVGGRWVPA